MLLSTSVIFHTAQAKPSRYTLDIPNKQTITLRDKSSGRMVWTRKNYFIRSNWSADHRAVVVEVDDGLLVWRQGHKVLRLDTPPMQAYIGIGHWDYTLGSLWSPDKKRFLVRAGGSGMDVLDLGELFCCELGPGQTARYIRAPRQEEGVRKMKWLDNRTIQFWTVKDIKNKEHLIPHVWRVP